MSSSTLRGMLAIGVVLLIFGCAGSATSTATPAATPTAMPTPASTPSTQALKIRTLGGNFVSFACRAAGKNPCRGPADAVEEATATSALTGEGTVRIALIVDDSDPGPNGDCNTVDEDGTFTFDTGTISFRSHHRDCSVLPPRIDTLFVVTGGTGAYVGVTGYGAETNEGDVVFYEGTITSQP